MVLFQLGLIIVQKYLKRSRFHTNAYAGQKNGKIVATATGGNGSITYSLNAGTYKTSGTFTGLIIGNHYIIAKDANSCKGVLNFTVDKICPTDTSMKLTGDMLKSINQNGSKTDRDSAVKYLNMYMNNPLFNVNTRLRLAHLLAQIMAETDGLRIKEESYDTIDYPRKKLLKKFSKYFDSSNINILINTPRIFDYIYSSNNENGPPSSGDGSKYRGHGLIQLTWKEEFRRFNTWYHQNFTDPVDLYNNPQLLETNMKYSVLSALWEATILKQLNPYADNDDVLAYSRGINIGNPQSLKRPNGLERRRASLQAAKKQLCL